MNIKYLFLIGIKEIICVRSPSNIFFCKSVFQWQHELFVFLDRSIQISYSNSNFCVEACITEKVKLTCWIACRNIFQIMWLYRMWDDFLTEVVDHISWRSIMCGSERPNKRRDPPWISVFASLFKASRFGLKVFEGKWLSESVSVSSEAPCTWWS